MIPEWPEGATRAEIRVTGLHRDFVLFSIHCEPFSKFRCPLHANKITTERLNQAVCLSLNETEAKNIISQHSLFDDHQKDSPIVNHHDQKTRLIYLEEKNIRLKWHGIVLSEYWRKKQIRWGLRFNKMPTLQDPRSRIHKEESKFWTSAQWT
jgi:hypothetical protein